MEFAPIGLQPLQGCRVVLERSAPKHAPFLRECYQNEEFMDLYRLAQNRDETEAQIKQRLVKEQQHLPQQLKGIEWVIHQQKQPIGLAALVDYKKYHQRAELLFGLTDSKYRGTASSLESYLLVLEFAFNIIKLHKVTALIYGYNDKAQKTVEHLGFVQEGLLRDHINTPKGFINMYFNGLTENDFRSSKSMQRLSKHFLKRDVTATPPLVEPLTKDYLAKVEQAIRM
ncbi:GNAT family N-acetyltransferase [Candidatus Marithrix sp. Canyon 246]|uniref:GNAT family N-acetyltransferase n=1 Tax=Candidatus Marithrix sp. Canyon 246 TaxID=1827136 RepID=UPI00084A0B5D|nr:GNAT family protein [Candidatus Marithrix sp. Canyon 246]